MGACRPVCVEPKPQIVAAVCMRESPALEGEADQRVCVCALEMLSEWCV